MYDSTVALNSFLGHKRTKVCQGVFKLGAKNDDCKYMLLILIKMLSTISSSGVKIYRKVLTPNIRVYCTNIFWQRIKTILTKLII